MRPVAQSLSHCEQLENRLGGEEKFQERVTQHLVPCLAQFSVAMADDSLWKPLNYQILLKMRDPSPKVRSRGASGDAVHSPRGLTGLHCCVSSSTRVQLCRAEG